MTAQVLHKTIEKAAGAGGMDFVLSDETPDRMNDVISADGWDWRDFSNNPIALFNHNSNFPIGKWANLRVDKQKRALIGRLQLAPEGTSDRIDEIRRLVEAGILKAVSVGFRPIEARPRENKDGGLLFVRQTLLESSLVAIPANPAALAVAKRLNISPDTRQLVFKMDAERRRQIIEQARATLARLDQAERRRRFEQQQQRDLATMSDSEFKRWLDSL
jgi:HK97 family phage prohead protease